VVYVVLNNAEILFVFVCVYSGVQHILALCVTW